MLYTWHAFCYLFYRLRIQNHKQKLGGIKMAEAKNTAKTTTTTKATGATTKKTETPKATPTPTATKSQGAKETDQWKEILENTRASYMSSLKSITKMQEETEKLIANLAQKSKSLQEENVKIVKEWIESGINLRDQFKKIFEDNYKKVLSVFEGLNIADMNMNFPFKTQFDDMVKKMEENMKKYFSFLKF